jgi:hypothetical protein
LLQKQQAKNQEGKLQARSDQTGILHKELQKQVMANGSTVPNLGKYVEVSLSFLNSLTTIFLFIFIVIYANGGTFLAAWQAARNTATPHVHII